jgi:uncharacterized damage-inducible protein DinB
MGLVAHAGPEAWCRELMEFHAWRRGKISHLLLEVDEKLFSEQLHGSFGSLYIILNHLVWAEKVWLGRVNRDAVATMKSSDVHGLLEAWKDVNEKWQGLLETASSDEVFREVEYFVSTGDRFSNSVCEIVVHMVDHSTYHIGQMMNAVRGFGIEPVSTNYIHYLRAKA